MMHPAGSPMDMDSPYLGQLIPSLPHNHLTEQSQREIKASVLNHGGLNGRCVEVLVSSKNAMKMDAAVASVTVWLQKLFGGPVPVVKNVGFASPSEIDEQPHGLDHTLEGAKNRLRNLKQELYDTTRDRTSTGSKDGVLRVLISLENGIMAEAINSVKNAAQFLTNSRTVWVDRCVEVGEVWFEGHGWEFSAISEGVTLPVKYAQASYDSGWKKTAGHFISSDFKCNAADWHEKMAGKGRQLIMENMAKVALGLPSGLPPLVPMQMPVLVDFKNYPNNPSQKSFPLPPKVRHHDEKKDANLFHQYNEQAVQFFVPEDSSSVIESEKKGVNLEDTQMWRELYKQIAYPGKFLPEPVKKPSDVDRAQEKKSSGVDQVPEKKPVHCPSVILTEDILAGYFDIAPNSKNRELGEVLHIVVLWNEKKNGWVLPGKVDGAYDEKNPEISLEDANHKLVKKELGLDPNQVAYHLPLSFFDDRKREEAMRSAGFASLVILKEKPVLEPGVRTGIPLKAFEELVLRERPLAPTPNSQFRANMARNHDSLVKTTMGGRKFDQTIEKVLIAQATFRDRLRADPRAARPPLPEVPIGLDCPVCYDILFEAKLICDEGHSLCGICIPDILKAANPECPECRKPIKATIPNISLDQAAKSVEPKRYAARYEEKYGRKFPSWRDQPACNGTEIQYKS